MKKHCLIIFFLMTIILIWSQDQVTIYNNDFSLVRTFLDLKLEKGLQDFYLDDIPSTIEANSVIINPQKNKFSIFAQNYEYDLANTEKILQKYIGKEFKIKTKSDEFFSGILQFTDGKTIGLIDDATKELILINRNEIQNINLAELPENFFLKPTLHWRLNAPKKDSYPTEFSYLCSGMEWEVTYNAVWNDEAEELVLNSWVTIENRTGKAFSEVKLKLMAGDVQKYQKMQSRGHYDLLSVERAVSGGSEAKFEEKAFHDFHLYTLSEKVSINNKQTKQLRLFPTKEIKANARYEYVTNSKKVKSQIEFVNSEKNELGIPLPQGIVKVYKQDVEDDLLEFIGEDRINHTPRKEEVTLTTGSAFDIVAETKELDVRKPAKRIKETDMKVILKNRSQQDKTITVLHSLYGDWTIFDESQSYKKESANKIEFEINVKAGAEEEISWTQRINY